MSQKQIGSFFCMISLVIIFSACSPSKGDAPGHEYMPDMFHSTAYEANTVNYYRYNTWGSKEDYMKYAMPRKPVAGTIARGAAGMGRSDAGDMAQHFQSMPVSGSVPYYYEDTEEERTRAMEEITTNPYPITADGLVDGKNLYEIFCGICHGPAGGGLGYLVRDDGGVYPAAPANMLLPEFVAASEGRFYHAIMYGKNVMGGYGDKLGYEERWNVIHYIRSLQAQDQKLSYDENENTLNSVGVPYGTLAHDDHDMPGSANHGGDDHDESDHTHDEEHSHDHDESHH